MKNLILISLGIILALSSCNEQKRIAKKVNKLGAENVLEWLKNNRKDLFITKIDTVRDTVVIQAVKTDTVLRYSTMVDYDTVTIVKDKLKIKIVKVHDTISVAGEYLGDTVYVEKPCPPAVLPKDGLNEFKLWKYFLIPMFILFLIIGLFLISKWRNRERIPTDS